MGRSWTFSIAPGVFSRAYYLPLRAHFIANAVTPPSISDLSSLDTLTPCCRACSPVVPTPDDRTLFCVHCQPTCPPPRFMRNDHGSYASNEVAINWQAALVFLIAGELQENKMAIAHHTQPFTGNVSDSNSRPSSTTCCIVLPPRKTIL
jgi:hypothetical protein